MINKNELINKNHYKFPDVDENNMIKYNKTYYSSNNHIYFSRYSNYSIYDKPLNSNKFIKISEIPLNLKIKQPLIDIKHSNFKIPFLSPKEVKEIYKPQLNHFYISLSLHCCLIILFFIASYFMQLQNKKIEFIEVTFGINDNNSQTAQKSNSDEIGETEATKTIRDLPQLTKNITPDTSPSIEDQIKFKDDSEKALFKEQKKLVKSEEKKEKKEITLNNKPLGPIPEKDKQKVKLEDFLNRKEIDTRKSSSMKTDGVRNKDETKPDGKLNTPDVVNKSPFASPSDSPANPFADSPSGVLEGKVSSKSYNTYKAYIGRQLKLNWLTSEGTTFPASLKSKVEFTINQYGYLIGKPKIISSSGNKEFDTLVLNSLESTFPVDERPPKDINPPKKFEAFYTSKTVK